MITLGLVEVQVADAAPNGVMPTSLKKIGKTYKDTAKLTQDPPEATEHFEEGNATPVVRKTSRKPPKFQFSIMDADIDTLVAYVGGTKVAKTTSTKTKWAYNGSEQVPNRAILIKTEQGLCFEIPNASIEASINADLSSKGIFLVDMVVTPLDVAEGKALRGYDPNEK